MPNWFKFYMDGWQWGNIADDMTLEQRAVYIELVIIAMRGWSYPVSALILSRRLGCSKELVDETISIAISTGRITIDDKRVLRLVRYEFAEPAPVVNNKYTNGFNNELKKRIRKRDKYICQNCGITETESKKLHNRKLTVHHIDYHKTNLDDDNLISLCTDCHLSTNTNRDYWQELFTCKLNNGQSMELDL